MARKRHTSEFAGQIGGGGDPINRCDGSYMLPLAGGIRGSEGRSGQRLKELEMENARLRRAVSDLTLDKMILAEAAGKLLPIRVACCMMQAPF